MKIIKDMKSRELTPNILSNTIWQTLWENCRPSNLDDFLNDLRYFDRVFENPAQSSYLFWIDQYGHTDTFDYWVPSSILIEWDAREKQLSFSDS